jgi:hypothetical protein
MSGAISLGAQRGAYAEARSGPPPGWPGRSQNASPGTLRRSGAYTAGRALDRRQRVRGRPHLDPAGKPACRPHQMRVVQQVLTGPRSACSPRSTSPSPCNASETPLRPGRRTDPDHRRGNAAAPLRHRHPAAPGKTGPTAALVHLATPPPAPHPPSPPTLERLRRDNTMITTNYSHRFTKT